MTYRYWIGLDLGQSQDFTTVAVLEGQASAQTPDAPSAGQPRGASKPVWTAFQCGHLERFQLGTPYPAIVERVRTLMHTPPLQGQARLVVDATGVGRPVIDMLRAAKLSPQAVLITGGDAESYDEATRYYRVPKRDLVAQVAVLLQNKRLAFAEGMPHVQTLVQELLNFQVKITTSAHDTYGAWREGTHDDLVLAVALAAWAGARWREPVMPRVQAYGTPVIRRLNRDDE